MRNLSLKFWDIKDLDIFGKNNGPFYVAVLSSLFGQHHPNPNQAIADEEMIMRLKSYMAYSFDKIFVRKQLVDNLHYQKKLVNMNR